MCADHCCIIPSVIFLCGLPRWFVQFMIPNSSCFINRTSDILHICLNEFSFSSMTCCTTFPFSHFCQYFYIRGFTSTCRILKHFISDAFSPSVCFSPCNLKQDVCKVVIPGLVSGEARMLELEVGWHLSPSQSRVGNNCPFDFYLFILIHFGSLGPEDNHFNSCIHVSIVYRVDRP